MDAVINFLKTLLTKLEVIIPTLITILGSCGGVLIYKMTSILANVGLLKQRLHEIETQIHRMENMLDKIIESLNERDEAINYLVESNPNALVKKKAREMISKFKKIDSITTLQNAVVSQDSRVKKVKIKKIKKVK